MNSLQSYHVSLKFLIQVPDPKVESVSEVTSAEPEHELMIDTTSPPDEITKRAEEYMVENLVRQHLRSFYIPNERRESR